MICIRTRGAHSTGFLLDTVGVPPHRGGARGDNSRHSMLPGALQAAVAERATGSVLVSSPASREPNTSARSLEQVSIQPASFELRAHGLRRKTATVDTSVGP